MCNICISIICVYKYAYTLIPDIYIYSNVYMYDYVYVCIYVYISPSYCMRNHQLYALLPLVRKTKWDL